MTDRPYIFKATASDDLKSVSLNAFDAELYWGKSNDGDLDEHAAYQKVAWVRRCVELRANALSSIPIRIVRQGSTDEAEWEFANTLPALLWVASASLQVYGASYWIRERNRWQIDRGYRWLSPVTMRPKIDAVKGLTGFTRTISGRAPIDLGIDDVVYVWSPSLEAEVGPGTGWVKTALAAAGLVWNIDQYGEAFFKRGAIAATVLSVEGMPPEQELDKLQSWWKRLLGGNKRAFETVAVRASVKPIPLSFPTSELAMTELMQGAREQIATAAGVPQTMLTEAANFATALEHHQAFYEETVIPQAIVIRDALNAQIFNPQGLELALDWQELEIFQEDENKRSQSLRQLTSAGVPLPMAMELLGFDLPNGMTYDQLRAELENERARRVAEQQKLVRQSAEAAAGEPQRGAQHAAPEQATRAMRDELDRWRRKALSALKAGDMPDVAFETELIDEDDQKALHEALAAASDAEGVRAAFDRWPFRAHDDEDDTPYP